MGLWQIRRDRGQPDCHPNRRRVDEEKSKVGYEIPFNRHFYVFEPPRDLHTIDEELKAVSANIMKMLEELAE